MSGALLLIITFSCSTPQDYLGKLDLNKWRSDKKGCKGLRKEALNDFKSCEKELLGRFADDIGALLGKPDIQQLGGRNQKFYVYFVENGTQCDSTSLKSEATKAILRFNAVGLLSEITYDTELF